MRYLLSILLFIAGNLYSQQYSLQPYFGISFPMCYVTGPKSNNNITVKNKFFSHPSNNIIDIGIILERISKNNFFANKIGIGFTKMKSSFKVKTIYNPTIQSNFGELYEAEDADDGNLGFLTLMYRFSVPFKKNKISIGLNCSYREDITNNVFPRRDFIILNNDSIGYYAEYDKTKKVNIGLNLSIERLIKIGKRKYVIEFVLNKGLRKLEESTIYTYYLGNKQQYKLRSYGDYFALNLRLPINLNRKKDKIKN